MTTFSNKPYELNGILILRLPQDTSAALSSRGQVMVAGEIDSKKFTAPLEPDGQGGHWLDITGLAKNNVDNVSVSFQPVETWPEPAIPKEFTDMLNSSVAAKTTWDKATSMAHWEWLRWITSTKNPDTYQKRIVVSRSKLEKGMRRPCCFDRASCTVAAVSKNGVLIDPRQ